MVRQCVRKSYLSDVFFLFSLSSNMCGWWNVKFQISTMFTIKNMIDPKGRSELWTMTTRWKWIKKIFQITNSLTRWLRQSLLPWISLSAVIIVVIAICNIWKYFSWVKWDKKKYSEIVINIIVISFLLNVKYLQFHLSILVRLSSSLWIFSHSPVSCCCWYCVMMNLSLSRGCGGIKNYDSTPAEMRCHISSKMWMNHKILFFIAARSWWMSKVENNIFISQIDVLLSWNSCLLPSISIQIHILPPLSHHFDVALFDFVN